MSMVGNLALARDTFYTGVVINKHYPELLSKRWWQRKMARRTAATHPVDAKPPAAPRIDADGPSDQVDRRLNRGLVSSSLALGVAAVGAWVLPPLQYASIPLLLYMGMPAAQALYTDLRDKRRLRTAFAETAILALCLTQRYYLAGPLGFWLYFAGRTLHQRRQVGARPTTAGVVRVASTDAEIELPIHDLQAGDTVIVRSGEIVPVDGVITAGSAWVDSAHAVAPSHRVIKKAHSHVGANHLVLAGCIFVQVEL